MVMQQVGQWTSEVELTGSVPGHTAVMQRL